MGNTHKSRVKIGKHAGTCQYRACTGPMLAASAQYSPSTGTKTSSVVSRILKMRANWTRAFYNLGPTVEMSGQLGQNMSNLGLPISERGTINPTSAKAPE